MRLESKQRTDTEQSAVFVMLQQNYYTPGICLGHFDFSVLHKCKEEVFSFAFMSVGDFSDRGKSFSQIETLVDNN